MVVLKRQKLTGCSSSVGSSDFWVCIQRGAHRAISHSIYASARSSELNYLLLISSFLNIFMAASCARERCIILILMDAANGLMTSAANDDH